VDECKSLISGRKRFTLFHPEDGCFLYPTVGRCKTKVRKLSVGGTSPSDLLEIEDLLTQGSRRGRTVGELVGEISKWTILIGQMGFDTTPSIPYPTLSLKPVLKAHGTTSKSALETMIRCTAVEFCFQFQLAPLCSNLTHEATAFKCCFETQFASLSLGWHRESFCHSC